MPHGAPEVDSPRDASIVVPEIRRARVVVRRRRARRHQYGNDGTWTARGSRRTIALAVVVCTAVFALMGVGLYYGLGLAEPKVGDSPHHVG